MLINQMFSGNLNTTTASNSRPQEISKPPRPAFYEAGDKFIPFSKRFREHIILCRYQGTDVSTYMLSHVRCQATWDRLSRLKLLPSERCYIDLLIKRFTEELYPPTQAWAIRVELVSLKQLAGDSIQEFCSKIEELATKAGFSSESERDKGCLQALVMGVRENT